MTVCEKTTDSSQRSHSTLHNNPFATCKTKKLVFLFEKTMKPLEIYESKSRIPRNQQSWTRQAVIGLGLWLVVWVVYTKSTRVGGDDERTTKLKRGTVSMVPGVAFPPMMEFINNSAGLLYPEHYPDCLFVVKQTIDPATNRTRYVLEQSLNDYWKHVVAFRRIQLKFNLGILVDMVETLNMDAPHNSHLQNDQLLLLDAASASSSSSTNEQVEHALLHRRIYEAGGSLPFYTHWNVMHDDPAICKNPLAFPIFRRSMPIECATNFSYWTIPTAPIIRQIKKVDWGHKMQHMVPRANQQKKVVVATTASEVNVPSTEITMLRTMGNNQLAGKLQCEYLVCLACLVLVLFSSALVVR
jgi:hypothetical protein